MLLHSFSFLHSHISLEYRDFTTTRWNSLGSQHCWNYIFPLFLSGYKILSGSDSKFPQWSVFGIRSNTTICLRRVWEKESRLLELKGFGNLNYEVSLERMIWNKWERKACGFGKRHMKYHCRALPPLRPSPSPLGRGGCLLALDSVSGCFSKYPIHLQTSTSFFRTPKGQDISEPTVKAQHHRDMG